MAKQEKPQPLYGTLTLPIDFGRKWLLWYLNGVRECLNDGTLGLWSTHARLLNGCKDDSLLPLEKRIVCDHELMRLPFTEDEFSTVSALTAGAKISEASKAEFRKAVYSLEPPRYCWQAPAAPVDPKVEKQISKDAARLRKEEAKEKKQKTLG